jgi:hypothetical protein
MVLSSRGPRGGASADCAPALSVARTAEPIRCGDDSYVRKRVEPAGDQDATAVATGEALRVKVTPALRCVVAVPRSDRSANADTIAAAGHFNTEEGAS